MERKRVESAPRKALTPKCTPPGTEIHHRPRLAGTQQAADTCWRPVSSKFLQCTPELPPSPPQSEKDPWDAAEEELGPGALGERLHPFPGLGVCGP